MALVGKRIKFKRDNTVYEGYVVDKIMTRFELSEVPSQTSYVVVLENNAVMVVNPKKIIEMIDHVVWPQQG